MTAVSGAFTPADLAETRRLLVGLPPRPDAATTEARTNTRRSKADQDADDKQWNDYHDRWGWL